MSKINIIMPTYNDCDTISETLDSLFSQTYLNWNVIIINDGSTDDTEKVVNNYKRKRDKNNKIKYLYQENQDQLKAIINGLKFADGEYIYLLHSDDLLYDNDILKKAVDYMRKNPSYDGIYGDMTIIDANSNVTGIQRVLPYINSRKTPVVQLLWLGRNLYIDFAFIKSEVFKKQVYYNYLIWDKPYWLSCEENVSMLNMKKVDFSLFKYRIYDGNYANNELGKLCLIMGEIRTATQLMAHYHIPLYKVQYILYRIFVHLNLYKMYKPFYKQHATINKAVVLKFIINKRYPEGYVNNIFLNNLVKFYENDVNRTLDFDSIYNGEVIYQGNGLRMFNKKILNDELDEFYIKFLTEMGKGFNEIVVSKKNLEKALDTVRFLCIYPFVKIRSK